MSELEGEEYHLRPAPTTALAAEEEEEEEATEERMCLEEDATAQTGVRSIFEGRREGEKEEKEVVEVEGADRAKSSPKASDEGLISAHFFLIVGSFEVQC